MRVEHLSLVQNCSYCPRASTSVPARTGFTFNHTQPVKFGGRAPTLRGCIKAERACWLVLLDIRMRLPLEEGILHLWIGGFVARPLGYGAVAFG